MSMVLVGVSGSQTEFPPMNDAALIIFTRNPELGKCKTRLAATIGDSNALEVYKYLIGHTVGITKELPFDCFVYYSEKIHTGDTWEDSIYQKAVQVSGDLGVKMKSAFQDLFTKGYKRVAIIGSDLFDLQSDDLIAGLQALSSNEVVLGPAQDGGYYFLGITEMIPQLFTNKEWGTDTVLADTLSNLKDKSVALLPVRNDIDYFEDLKDRPEFEPFIPEHLK